MQPHRDRLRQIRLADDDRDRRAADRVAEDHETGRDAAIERDVASAATASEAIAGARKCATASAATVISGGSHAFTPAAPPSPTSKRRQPLRELGQLDGGTPRSRRRAPHRGAG